MNIIGFYTQKLYTKINKCKFKASYLRHSTDTEKIDNTIWGTTTDYLLSQS